MNLTTNSVIVHVLAVLAGVLSILAASAPALGIPTYFVGLIGVIIAVLIYVGNQMSALGSTALSVTLPATTTTTTATLTPKPAAPAAAK